MVKLEVDEMTHEILMRILEKLKKRGLEADKNVILREALRLYERFRLGSEEELLIQIWDRLDRVESEILKIKSEVDSLKALTEVHEKPLQPPVPRVKEEAKEIRRDKFLEFLRDMIVYPLDKIRKPRHVIERLVSEGIVEIIEASNRSYIVYKPKKDEFLKKLPMPLDEVRKLSGRERQLVEVLKNAALVYEDAITKTLREVK